MIAVEKTSVAGIPLLEVAPLERFSQPLPTVIFLHGFTSAKEHNLHYAYLLAEKGIRTLLPEAEFHGERAANAHSIHSPEKFWDIVVTAIKELETVKDAWERQGKIMPGKIGVAGTSMGGIVTLGALVRYDWIRAAVSLMGCPEYVPFAKYLLAQMEKLQMKISLSAEEIERRLEILSRFDPASNREKFTACPLLFWHGKKDQTVPHHFAYRFFQEMRKRYENPEQIRFILDEQADHKVTREGVKAAVDWLHQYLSGS